MFEVGDDGLVPLDGEEGIRAVFARLSRSETKIHQGVGTNLVFIKGVDAAALADLRLD